MPATKRPHKIVLNADAVWERMCRQNLTHRELAKDLGISRSYLSQLLNGQRSPSAGLRVKLQRIFNAKFDDIFLIVQNA